MRPRKRHAVWPDPRVYRSNPRMNSGPRCVVAAQTNPSGGASAQSASYRCHRPTLISPRWCSTAARRNGVPGAIACSSHRLAGAGRASSRSGVNGAGSTVGVTSRRQSMRHRFRQRPRCLDGNRHRGHRTDPARRVVGAGPAGTTAGLITTTGHDANSTRVRLVEPCGLPESVSPHARRRGPVRRDHGRRRRLPAQAGPGRRPGRRRPHGRRRRLAARPHGHRRWCWSGCAGRRAGRSPLRPLSPQERRILELIADGLTNRQIGAEMFLAEKTVKNYVSTCCPSSASPAAPRPPCRRRSCTVAAATDRRWPSRPGSAGAAPASSAACRRRLGPHRQLAAALPRPLLEVAQPAARRVAGRCRRRRRPRRSAGRRPPPR